jgi:hypothetical protein
VPAAVSGGGGGGRGRGAVKAVREGRVAASAAGCSARIRPGCSSRSRPPEGISPLLSATALPRHAAVTGYARGQRRRLQQRPLCGSESRQVVWIRHLS